MSDLKEIPHSEKVYQCVHSCATLLNQEILIPILFIFNPNIISIMGAWYKAVEWMHFISDNARHIYPSSYSIGTICSNEDIESMSLDLTIGNSENPRLEIEKLFTKHHLSEITFSRLNCAAESIKSVVYKMDVFLNQHNNDLTKAYSQLKTIYTQESKEEEELNDECYPTLQLVVSMKFEDVSKIDAILTTLSKTLPEYLKMQHVDTSLSTDVVQSNINVLSASMNRTLGHNTRKLCKASAGYLYNIPEPLMVLFRYLAKEIHCKICVDDRLYHINPQKPNTSITKKFYVSVHTFKQKAYYERGYGEFNYIMIQDKDVNAAKSRLGFIGFKCDHFWETDIGTHTANTTNTNHRNHGCPICGKDKYTLPIAIQKGIKAYGEGRFDYGNNKPEDITGVYSKLNYKCMVLTCGADCTTTVNEHINGGVGCQSCKLGKWTIYRIVIDASKVHCNYYSYVELIASNMKIENTKTRIPVYCPNCNETWWPKINDHVDGLTGCPHCRNSKGEMAVKGYLKGKNIQYIPQFILIQNGCNSKKYDFLFMWNQRWYLIEFDGRQHFRFTPYFNKDVEDFFRRQQVDVDKTKAAIAYNVFLIRIDDTLLDRVGMHIEEGIRVSQDLSKKYYFSDPEKYRYISDKL